MSPVSTPARCAGSSVSVSAGGVLDDLLALRPWWEDHRTVWAAVRHSDTLGKLDGQHVRWIREVKASRPLGLVPSLIGAMRIMRSERPDLIVSAGSGSAVAMFLVAWCLR